MPKRLGKDHARQYIGEPTLSRPAPSKSHMDSLLIDLKYAVRN